MMRYMSDFGIVPGINPECPAHVRRSNITLLRIMIHMWAHKTLSARNVVGDERLLTNVALHNTIYHYRSYTRLAFLNGVDIIIDCGEICLPDAKWPRATRPE